MYIYIPPTLKSTGEESPLRDNDDTALYIGTDTVISVIPNMNPSQRFVKPNSNTCQLKKIMSLQLFIQ